MARTFDHSEWLNLGADIDRGDWGMCAHTNKLITLFKLLNVFFDLFYSVPVFNVSLDKWRQSSLLSF